MQKDYSYFQRVVALVTALVFFTTSVVEWSYASAAPTPETHLQFISELGIPADIATVRDSFGDFSEKGDHVFVIEDAHTNYDAQTNTKALLEYLQTKLNIHHAYVEGAAAPLAPERIRFYEDEATNVRLAGELAKKGEVTGIELFLLEHGNHFQANGVEDLGMYAENLALYRRVLGAKAESVELLKILRSQTERIISRLFGARLREIVRQWMAFREQRMDLDQWIPELERAARDLVHVDFEDPMAQLKWPQLVRLYRLKQLEQDIDTEKMEQELIRVEVLMKAAGQEGLAQEFRQLLTVEGEPELRLRRAMEDLYRRMQPLGFSFNAYPALRNFTAVTIFRREMNALEMMTELERLVDTLMETLAVTDAEKEFLPFIKRLYLLENALTLTLTREQWDQLGDEVRPEALLDELSRHSRNLAIEGLDEESLNKRYARVFNLTESVKRFYETARARERVLVKNTLAGMKSEGINNAVMIAGGFHTDGIAALLREAGVSHLVLSPNIRNIKDDEQDYYCMMTGRCDTAVPVLHTGLNSAAIHRESAGLRAYRYRLRRIVETIVGLGIGSLEDDRERVLRSFGLLADRSELRDQPVPTDAVEDHLIKPVLNRLQASHPDVAANLKLNITFEGEANIFWAKNMTKPVAIYSEVLDIGPRTASLAIDSRLRSAFIEASNSGNPLFAAAAEDALLLLVLREAIALNSPHVSDTLNLPVAIAFTSFLEQSMSFKELSSRLALEHVSDWEDYFKQVIGILDAAAPEFRLATLHRLWMEQAAGHQTLGDIDEIINFVSKEGGVDMGSDVVTMTVSEGLASASANRRAVLESRKRILLRELAAMQQGPARFRGVGSLVPWDLPAEDGYNLAGEPQGLFSQDGKYVALGLRYEQGDSGLSGVSDGDLVTEGASNGIMNQVVLYGVLHDAQSHIVDDVREYRTIPAEALTRFAEITGLVMSSDNQLLVVSGPARDGGKTLVSVFNISGKLQLKDGQAVDGEVYDELRTLEFDETPDFVEIAADNYALFVGLGKELRRYEFIMDEAEISGLKAPVIGKTATYEVKAAAEIPEAVPLLARLKFVEGKSPELSLRHDGNVAEAMIQMLSSIPIAALSDGSAVLAVSASKALMMGLQAETVGSLAVAEAIQARVRVIETEIAAIDAPQRSELRTADFDPEKHPATIEITSYYTSRDHLRMALAIGNAELYTQALGESIHFAKKAMDLIDHRGEVQTIVSYLRTKQDVPFQRDTIGDTFEITRVQEDKFSREEQEMIEVETQKFLKALGFQGSVAEDLAREIMLVSYPLSLANMMPPTIEGAEFQPEMTREIGKSLHQFVFAESLTLGGAVVVNPSLAKDITIQILQKNDPIAFKGSFLHEVVHFLALKNALPFDVSRELVTQAITTAVFLTEAGSLEPILSQIPEDMQEWRILYETVVSWGETAAEQGHRIKRPEELDSMVRDFIETRVPEIMNMPYAKYNDFVDRLSGVYLGAFAAKTKALDPKTNLYKFIVDYGIRHLPRVRNNAFTRSLTQRDHAFIQEVMKTLSAVAQVTIPDGRITFKEQSMKETQERGLGRMVYDADKHVIYYLPWDIVEFGKDASVGHLLQEIFRYQHTYDGEIEEAYDHTAFRLLFSVAESARVVALGLAEFPERLIDIEAFYERKLRILDLEIEKDRMAEQPKFVQYVEGLFYALAKSGDPENPEWDPRIVTDIVKEALNDTFAVVAEAMAAEGPTAGRYFYEVIRDQVWPVVERLLELDKKEALEQELENQTMSQMIENGDFEIVEAPPSEGEPSPMPLPPGAKLKINISPGSTAGAIDMKDLSPEARAALEEAMKKFMENMDDEQKKKFEEAARQALENSLEDAVDGMAPITSGMDGELPGQGKFKPGRGSPQVPGRGDVSTDALGELYQDLEEAEDQANRISQQADAIEAEAARVIQEALDAARQAAEIDREGEGDKAKALEMEKALAGLAQQLKNLRAEANRFHDMADDVEAKIDDVRDDPDLDQDQVQEIRDRVDDLQGKALEIDDDAAGADKDGQQAVKSGDEMKDMMERDPDRTNFIKGRAKRVQETLEDAKGRLDEVQKDAQEAAAQSGDLKGETRAMRQGVVQNAPMEVEESPVPDISVDDGLEDAPGEGGVGAGGGDPGGHIKIKMPNRSRPGKKRRRKQAQKKGLQPEKVRKHTVDPRVAESLRELLQDEAFQAPEKPFDIDDFYTATEPGDVSPDQRHIYDMIRNLSRSHEATIRDAILSVLDELESTEDIPRQKKGRLDGRRLAVVDSGIKDINKRKVTPDAPVVRVSILIDVSGSMFSDVNNLQVIPPVSDEYLEQALKTKNRITNAVRTALLFMEAFRNEERVELEIGLFAARQKIILRFGEEITDAKAYEVIRTILNHGLGGDNTDLAGLQMMVNSQREREAEMGPASKIVVIIADGGINYTDALGLQTTMQNNTDMAFLPRGIGPASANVKGAYAPFGKEVDDVTKLAKGLGDDVLNEIERLRPTGGDDRSELRVMHPVIVRPERFETDNFKVVREGKDEFLVVKGGRYPTFKAKVDKGGRNVPDEDLYETETNVADVVQIIKHVRNQDLDRSPLYIEGEAGTAKNKKVYYAAKLLRKATRYMAMHDDIHDDDLTERRGVNEKEEGKTDWIPSPLVEAMMNGDWIILDEVNKAKTTVLQKLNQIIQSRRVVLHDGTVVTAKPGFAVIMMANPPPSSGDAKVYSVQKISAEIMDRLRYMKIDYLPRHEELQLLFHILMKKRGLKTASSIPNVDKEMVRKLVDAARIIRERYEDVDPATNLSRGRGKKVARPFSTRALVNIVEHIAAYPEERDRIRSVIKRFYSYEWEKDDQVRKVEEALNNKLPRFDEPYVFSDGDLMGPKYSTNAEGKRVLEFAGVQVELGEHAPLGMDDVPLEMRLTWTSKNLEYLRHMMMDLRAGNHMLFIGEAGTGKDTIAEYVTYLTHGPVVETFGVTKNAMAEDFIAYVGLGEGEKVAKDGLVLAVGKNETGLVPSYVVRAMLAGRPVILSEINKGKPEVFAALNNILEYGWIDLANGRRVHAEPGFVIIGTMNPPKRQYMGNYGLSGEFIDRFSTYKFDYLERDQEVDILEDFNQYIRTLPDRNFYRLKREFIEKITDMVRILRRRYDDNELPHPVSMRALKRLIVTFAEYPEIYKAEKKDTEKQTPLEKAILSSIFFHDPVHQEEVLKAMRAANVKGLRDIVEFDVSTGSQVLDAAFQQLRSNLGSIDSMIRALAEFDRLIEDNKDKIPPAIFKKAQPAYRHLVANEFPPKWGESQLADAVVVHVLQRLGGELALPVLPPINREVLRTGPLDLAAHPEFGVRFIGDMVQGIAEVTGQKQDARFLKIAGKVFLGLRKGFSAKQIVRAFERDGLKLYGTERTGDSKGGEYFAAFFGLAKDVQDAVRSNTAITEVANYEARIKVLGLSQDWVDVFAKLSRPAVNPVLAKTWRDQLITAVDLSKRDRIVRLAILLTLQILFKNSDRVFMDQVVRERIKILSRSELRSDEDSQPQQHLSIWPVQGKPAPSSGFVPVDEIDVKLVLSAALKELRTQHFALYQNLWTEINAEWGPNFLWVEGLPAPAMVYAHELDGGDRATVFALDVGLRGYLEKAYSEKNEKRKEAATEFLLMLLIGEAASLEGRPMKETRTPDLKNDLLAALTVAKHFYSVPSQAPVQQSALFAVVKEGNRFVFKRSDGPAIDLSRGLEAVNGVQFTVNEGGEPRVHFHGSGQGVWGLYDQFGRKVGPFEQIVPWPVEYPVSMRDGKGGIQTYFWVLQDGQWILYNQDGVIGDGLNDLKNTFAHVERPRLYENENGDPYILFIGQPAGSNWGLYSVTQSEGQGPVVTLFQGGFDSRRHRDFDEKESGVGYPQPLRLPDGRRSLVVQNNLQLIYRGAALGEEAIFHNRKTVKAGFEETGEPHPAADSKGRIYTFFRAKEKNPAEPNEKGLWRIYNNAVPVSAPLAEIGEPEPFFDKQEGAHALYKGRAAGDDAPWHLYQDGMPLTKAYEEIGDVRVVVTPDKEVAIIFAARTSESWGVYQQSPGAEPGTEVLHEDGFSNIRHLTVAVDERGTRRIYFTSLNDTTWAAHVDFRAVWHGPEEPSAARVMHTDDGNVDFYFEAAYSGHRALFNGDGEIAKSFGTLLDAVVAFEAVNFGREEGAVQKLKPEERGKRRRDLLAALLKELGERPAAAHMTQLLQVLRRFSGESVSGEAGITALTDHLFTQPAYQKAYQRTGQDVMATIQEVVAENRKRSELRSDGPKEPKIAPVDEINIEMLRGALDVLKAKNPDVYADIDRAVSSQYGKSYLWVQNIPGIAALYTDTLDDGEVYSSLGINVAWRGLIEAVYASLKVDAMKDLDYFLYLVLLREGRKLRGGDFNETITPNPALELRAFLSAADGYFTLGSGATERHIVMAQVHAENGKHFIRTSDGQTLQVEYNLQLDDIKNLMMAIDDVGNPHLFYTGQRPDGKMSLYDSNEALAEAYDEIKFAAGPIDRTGFVQAFYFGKRDGKWALFRNKEHLISGLEGVGAARIALDKRGDTHLFFTALKGGVWRLYRDGELYFKDAEEELADTDEPDMSTPEARGRALRAAVEETAAGRVIRDALENMGITSPNPGESMLDEFSGGPIDDDLAFQLLEDLEGGAADEHILIPFEELDAEPDFEEVPAVTGPELALAQRMEKQILAILNIPSPTRAAVLQDLVEKIATLLNPRIIARVPESILINISGRLQRAQETPGFKKYSRALQGMVDKVKARLEEVKAAKRTAGERRPSAGAVLAGASAALTRGIGLKPNRRHIFAVETMQDGDDRTQVFIAARVQNGKVSLFRETTRLVAEVDKVQDMITVADGEGNPHLISVVKRGVNSVLYLDSDEVKGDFEEVGHVAPLVDKRGRVQVYFTAKKNGTWELYRNAVKLMASADDIQKPVVLLDGNGNEHVVVPRASRTTSVEMIDFLIQTRPKTDEPAEEELYNEKQVLASGFKRFGKPAVGLDTNGRIRIVFTGTKEKGSGSDRTEVWSLFDGENEILKGSAFIGDPVAANDKTGKFIYYYVAKETGFIMRSETYALYKDEGYGPVKTAAGFSDMQPPVLIPAARGGVEGYFTGRKKSAFGIYDESGALARGFGEGLVEVAGMGADVVTRDDTDTQKTAADTLLLRQRVQSLIGRLRPKEMHAGWKTFFDFLDKIGPYGLNEEKNVRAILDYVLKFPRFKAFRPMPAKDVEKLINEIMAEREKAAQRSELRAADAVYAGVELAQDATFSIYEHEDADVQVRVQRILIFGDHEPVTYAASAVAAMERARGIALARYLDVLQIKAGEGAFAAVFDLSELTPKLADQLGRHDDGDQHYVIADNVLTDSLEDQATRRRNLRSLQQRLDRNRIHLVERNAAIIQKIADLHLGEQAASIAAFSENVNTAFADQSQDFSLAVNGVTLRFQNREVRRAGLDVDLFAYAIPLIRVLGTATREQVPDLLNRFNLEFNAKGEIAVGLNFLEALSQILEEHETDLLTAIAA
ncbi:MAG: AAA family ATPase [Candidatus Omnitrophota bacterium]|nr:AAA family ATPase [Candidatus Omnitrophota bacterium]